MSKACIDRSDSLIFQHKRRPRVTKNTKTKKCIFWVHIRVLWSSFPLHWKPNIYWSIMRADDSIKCRCANSSITGQVGGFQNPGVCLQAFPSFFPHPLPTLLLTPFFAQSLTLVPRSLLLNRTETLATQAILDLLLKTSFWTNAYPSYYIILSYLVKNSIQKIVANA